MDSDNTYFLIHEARYTRILKEIEKITKADSRLPARNASQRVAGGRGNDKIRILDVGCYPYHLGAALTEAGHEVWGISSPHEPMKQKRVAILNIETDPFPYKDNFFDLTLCSEVIEHLVRSPIPAIREMYRVTRPGGYLVLTTPNVNSTTHLLFRLLGHAPSGEKTTNIYHHHNHEYTLRELVGVVHSAGWTMTKATRVIGYPPFRRRNRTDPPLLWLGKCANFLVMSALPPTRDTLLVVGKK